ncbi:uncharacterized protein LOC110039114 [Phalaenopsis equestris]|uniref:uncharacterized protein LOC110039114 n=1 Tax=Phalaenopsis equestris TaxID=78828 RepID=UPI0009E59245|nr:uncharacterized protein LOC110039114 [Phalaenopsis equestris]
MVPARNLLRRHYDCYGGYFTDPYFEKRTKALKSPEFMAGLSNGEEEEEEEVGTSSRDAGGDQCRDSWLQLGVGLRPQLSRGSQTGGRSVQPLSTELELFGPRQENMNLSMFPPPPQPPQHLGVFYPPWFAMGVGQPASGEVRLMNMPARAPVGVWFMLKAAQNQVREPFLPQIPKSYLRIKDGRMTVRLLKKYLVNKLGLEDESEVEISCRGQPLHPFLTLQHIRDSIWRLRETSTSLTLLPASPCDDHLMTLQYCRSS